MSVYEQTTFFTRTRHAHAYSTLPSYQAINTRPADDTFGVTSSHAGKNPCYFSETGSRTIGQNSATLIGQKASLLIGPAQTTRPARPNLTSLEARRVQIPVCTYQCTYQCTPYRQLEVTCR